MVGDEREAGKGLARGFEERHLGGDGFVKHGRVVVVRCEEGRECGEEGKSERYSLWVIYLWMHVNWLIFFLYRGGMKPLCVIASL